MLRLALYMEKTSRVGRRGTVVVFWTQGGFVLHLYLRLMAKWHVLALTGDSLLQLNYLVIPD